MSQARTARRRRKQASMNNAHLSGLGVPRYGRTTDRDAKMNRIKREMEKARREGRSYGYSKK